MTRPLLVATCLAALSGLPPGSAAAQRMMPVQPALSPGLGDAAAGAPGVGAAEERVRSGVFTTLTYNVGGIPQLVSRGNPRRNNPLIGPLLSSYDLVLVQEDFMYHDEMSAGVALPHHSPPHPIPASVMTLGDGLSQYSRFPFDGFEREGWEECNGLFGYYSDCTARKGLSFARLRLGDGATVDVYNLHFDAGWDDSDQETRTTQVDHLIETVLRRSAGHAVILAGDTNFRSPPADLANFDRILEELDLVDSCMELRCPRQRVDRVLYRSGGGVALRAVAYELPREFVDDEGAPLSDHWPVAVTFRWAAARSSLQATGAR